MTPTLTQSAERSKKSLNSISFVMPVSGDFWEFYSENKKSFDHVLDTVCYKQHEMDPDEFRHEVLIRCFENDILSKFDPSRSALNTYITMQVRSRASHVLNKAIHNRHGIRGGYEDKSRRDISFSEVHQWIPDASCSVDSTVEARDFQKCIEDTLTDVEKATFRLVVKGYKAKEIAEKMGVSSQNVSLKTAIIRRKIRKVISR